MGIAAAKQDGNTVVLALAYHDTTYLVDFSIEHLPSKDNDPVGEDAISNRVIELVQKYEQDNYVKIIGAGVSTVLQKLSPTLCSRLWLQIDVIPIVIRPKQHLERPSFWDAKHVDEKADSMARKCVM
jgi:hypothetical protein